MFFVYKVIWKFVVNLRFDEDDTCILLFSKLAKASR